VDQDIEFLQWLSRRLIYRYGYHQNDDVIKNLSNISNKLKSKHSIKISDTDLDKIIGKYYVDFFLNKEPYGDTSIGFTNKERETLRKNIRNLTFDIVNKNIPREKVIKDI
jgi:hypothetical protein